MKKYCLYFLLKNCTNQLKTRNLLFLELNNNDNFRGNRYILSLILIIMSQLESNREFDKRASFYDFFQNLGQKGKERTMLWTKNQLDTIQRLIKNHGLDIKHSTILDIGGGTGRIAVPLSLVCKKLILAEPSKGSHLRKNP